jgi:lysophospholipase L1-like esterase
MKNPVIFAKSVGFALVCAVLVGAFPPDASGAIVQTVTYGASQTALDGVIAVNLLQAGQNSLATVTASTLPANSPTFTTAGLNDGSAAAAANMTWYAVNNAGGGNMPVTVTFNLNTNNGTGGSTTGYDISSLQAITGWSAGNFGNQKFQLLFSINGGSFIDYGTFTATTSTNSGNNSILTTLTSASGPNAMAKGVTAIQFVFQNPGGSQSAPGGTVIHEIQAFGTPTVSNTQPVPYRIVAVGDSITAGYLDNPNWTLPYQFGYRNGLLTRLVNAGYAFKFVGGSPEPWNGFSGTPGNIPNPDLRVAGQDGCEGFGGKGAAFVLGNMSAWLSVDQPDVMLLMIGINDIGQGSIGEPASVELNLSNIVATVVSKSPNTHLIVAQITPYATYSDSITKYNNYISNVLVPYFAGQGKYVTTVNQYTNLCVAGTTIIDPTAFANGINHPNNAAYDRMAQTWFNGIQALSLDVPQTSTANENLVVNGSFEAPQFASNSHNANPANSTGWTFAWGGISGAGAGIDNGNAYGQGGSDSYDGSQRACLQSSGNSTVSHLSQAVSCFKVGQFYQLSFHAKGIGAFSGANPFQVSIISGSYTNVLFGGSAITPPTTGYTLYNSAPFRATNSVMTLDFADLAPGVVTYVSWIDGVSINPVSGINLLANGGFEAPTYGINTHNINPSSSYGWTFTSAASGGGSGIDNGDPYGSNNGSSIEFAGRQQACLQSSGNSTLTGISQTVTNLTVGQYYQVSFLAKAINGFSGANPFQVKTISGTTTNVLFGDSDVWPSASGYQDYTSAPFQATSSTMTVMFADHGLSSAAYVSWLDNVSLYAVSAPTITATPQTGSSVSSFDGAVAVNLIRNGQPSLSSVSASHGPSIPTAFTTAGLNDGSAAANANLTYYGNTDSTGGNLPVTLTFNLNTNRQTGGSPGGYVATNVQVISGWSDSYLANQNLQLLFSINGGAFTDYGTYQCFNYLNGGNNSLLQSIQGNGSVLASNVTGVQFIFQAPQAPQGGSGGTLIRELQVFGMAIDNPPVGGQVSSIAFTNGVVSMSFAGIPGYKYNVQVTTNLTNPNWTTIWTTNAPMGGVFQFQDNNAPLPTAYYRLMWNGN